MKKITTILIIAVIGLISCNAPKMDADLVKSMTTGYDKGVVGGISIGDSWEDVKSNIHKGWELDESIHKFSKVWDDFNNVILSIDMDSENKVRSINLTINGKEGNHLLISEVQNILQKEFNIKYGAKINDSWSYKAPNGSDCSITMNLNKQETGTHSFNVDVYSLTQ